MFGVGKQDDPNKVPRNLHHFSVNARYLLGDPGLGRIRHIVMFGDSGVQRHLCYLGLAYATRENPLEAQISFLFTNSWIPRSESSLPYPDRLIPPKGRSAVLTEG